MTGCRSLALVLVFLAMVPSVPVRGAEPLPTAAQVIEGYRRNLAQFPAPHVTIRTSTRASEAARRFWLARATAMQEALADPARSEVQRQHAQAVLDAARDELDSGEEAYTHLDFWTDRRDWQSRLPFAEADGAQPAAYAFPREPPSASTLASVYRRARIYTFAPDMNPATSAWYGVPNPGAPAFARVSDAVLDELPADFQLPPLCGQPGKSAQLAHPIDAVFLRGGEPLRVVGFEMLGERRTLRVEQALFEPSDAPHRAPGTLEEGEVITAWLDPAQGYLPLRVEWHNAWRLSGRMLNANQRPVHAALTVTRVERFGGGFYPVAGTIEFRGAFGGAGAQANIDEVASGKPYNPVLASVRELAWTVAAVDPRAGASASLYQVEFPAGTEVFDEQALVAPRKLAPLSIGQAAPELRVTQWTDGTKRSLADFRGKVVVLYFWMAWQDPCMGPLAVLEALQEKYGPRGVVVLGVHVGNVELAELRRAMADGGATFPAALDVGTAQTAGSTLAAYRIQLYPTTILLDRAGRVAFTTADERSGDWSRQAAASLGIKFPLSERLTPDEQNRIWNKIYGAMLEGQIERIASSR